jgi:hypothetical protein
LLHDGRTSDLIEAIQGHASPGNGRIPPSQSDRATPGNARILPSEASQVIATFNKLPEAYKQSILNFLRGL